VSGYEKERSLINVVNKNMFRENKNISNDILLCIAFAGVISVAATSPYFFVNIAKFILRNKKYLKNKYDQNKIAKTLERLKRNRLIILNEKDGFFNVELTREGKRKIEKIKLENLAIMTPKFWDNKWRIVIFDIPEKQRKRARNALREKLQKLGFYQLQKSVWAYPYPCEKEVQFLCELFDIYRFVNIITADKIYNDILLRKHFKLL